VLDRQKIQDRLRKKEQEIQALEEKLRAAKVYIQALQDVIRLMEEDDNASESVQQEASLKPGSAVAKARELILAKGTPLHISDLLLALGKESTRESRASLTSSLAAYVRRGEIFTRPAPNTFGLAELGHVAITAEPEPPSDFGGAP
jgi:hypothetical protein